MLVEVALNVLVWIPVIAFILYLIGLLICLHGKQKLRIVKKTLEGSDKDVKPIVIGFFHPYCNAGGGGERVLWVAIKALQNKYSHVKCVIYTGDTQVTGEEIIQKAKQRFNIVLPRSDPDAVRFVFLKARKLVEPSPYPYFTMLGQSFGSVILAIEAMWKFVPDIFFDSMGYAFTLPLFKYLGGCSIGCYVHYPTISTDMLKRVGQRTLAYNNQIAKNQVLSQIKLIYYNIFAALYGLVGKRSDLILVNSSWTEDHIISLWQSPLKTYVIYPPCDIAGFVNLPLDQKVKPRTIVSIAQFRPEKDHPLQLNAFAKYLSKSEDSETKLVLVGSCRNEEDKARVNDLKNLAEELHIAERVEFRLNVPYAELKQCLSEATVGLHTMWNEHFGIGVVEMMAAGTIVLAHNSGGPKMDIVKEIKDDATLFGKTGFLADDEESYAKSMEEILNLDHEKIKKIQLNARQCVEKFSDENFENKFIDAMEKLI